MSIYEQSLSPEALRRFQARKAAAAASWTSRERELRAERRAAKAAR